MQSMVTATGTVAVEEADVAPDDLVDDDEGDEGGESSAVPAMSAFHCCPSADDMVVGHFKDFASELRADEDEELL